MTRTNSRISVVGAGAFGTALASTWAHHSQDVTLWGRNARAVQDMQDTRRCPKLPDSQLAPDLTFTASLDAALAADIIVMATPAQTLRPFLEQHRGVLHDKTIVAACKGIDLHSMTGPASTITATLPSATAAILTGPSFATDIARGLPTALTLATRGDGAALQDILANQTLRIYRTCDIVGAELGGALKNVIAIACGVAIGAGLGESARAALMTRGFAEMQRIAQRLGADPDTLTGLSGFGDLALTCTSAGSRNYRLGLSIGQGTDFDPKTTVEGAATAKAIKQLAANMDIDAPVCGVTADLVEMKISVTSALDALLSRPLKEE